MKKGVWMEMLATNGQYKKFIEANKYVFGTHSRMPDGMMLANPEISMEELLDEISLMYPEHRGPVSLYDLAWLYSVTCLVLILRPAGSHQVRGVKSEKAISVTDKSELLRRTLGRVSPGLPPPHIHSQQSFLPVHRLTGQSITSKTLKLKNHEKSTFN